MGKSAAARATPVAPAMEGENHILLRESGNKAGEAGEAGEAGQGIARLTLNRPASRNALSEALIADLTRQLDLIAKDDTIRVVILAANGPVFCAGHDLKEMTACRASPDRGRAAFRRIMADCSTLMQTIVNLPKPVIARVHATATAAGCQLVASCDLAVAADSASFATPGVHIGLFCSTPMVALSRSVARKHAMEMLLLGDPINARRAADIGLVNAAVPDEQLDQKVDDMAQAIAKKSALTLRIGKETFQRQMDKSLSAAYDHAARVMAMNMLARDAEEGIGAFMEKRPPDWQNR